MICPFCKSTNTTEIPAELRGTADLRDRCIDCGAAWKGNEKDGYGVLSFTEYAKDSRSVIVSTPEGEDEFYRLFKEGS